MVDVLAPFESMFSGDLRQIFRGQFQSCVVRDYNAADPLINFTPFGTDGNISSAFQTAIANGTWIDLGYGGKTGLTFEPTLTLVTTDASQSRRELVTDISKQANKVKFQAEQSNPVVDALQANLPLASMATLGAAGYAFTAPVYPFPVYRQLLAFSFMVTQAGLLWCKCRVYPSVLMLVPSKLENSVENPEMTELTFEPREDQIAGFAERTIADGPGWRALGGTTGVPGTPVATAGGSGVVVLTFTAPTTRNSPFMYNVFKGGVAVLGTNVTVGGTAANPILTLAAQATGAATYTVQAVGSNLSGSAQTPASNSVTVT
jgi:hypothetical protein